MFTFQAIHNYLHLRYCSEGDVKELISMFTFQAIHNIEDKQKELELMSKS